MAARKYQHPTTEATRSAPLDQLLTEDQAAERLNWSKKTLQRRRWEGNPPAFVKLGRTVRYSLRDLEAFIEAGRQVPAQAT